MAYDVNDGGGARQRARRGARNAALKTERELIDEVVDDAARNGTLMVGETTARPTSASAILRATRARFVDRSRFPRGTRNGI